MPVFALFFGIGELAKIAVIGWVSLWPIVFYTITATRSIDPILIKTGVSLGISPKELLVKVVLPASLPTIFTGIRISAGLTFFILIASEMLGGSSGLGYLVHTSAMNYQIPRIYAGATFIILFGFFLNRALLFVERRLCCREASTICVSLPTTENIPEWRPQRFRFAIALAAVLLMVVMVFGGLEVQQRSSKSSPIAREEGKHSRHLGSTVNGE
jgi:NitT/TauT family transport system permease protein